MLWGLRSSLQGVPWGPNCPPRSQVCQQTQTKKYLHEKLKDGNRMIQTKEPFWPYPPCPRQTTTRTQGPHQPWFQGSRGLASPSPSSPQKQMALPSPAGLCQVRSCTFHSEQTPNAWLVCRIPGLGVRSCIGPRKRGGCLHSGEAYPPERSRLASTCYQVDAGVFDQ